MTLLLWIAGGVMLLAGGIALDLHGTATAENGAYPNAERLLLVAGPALIVLGALLWRAA